MVFLNQVYGQKPHNKDIPGGGFHRKHLELTSKPVKPERKIAAYIQYVEGVNWKIKNMRSHSDE